jgi:energy-coupling factor transport system substrate-specific component
MKQVLILKKKKKSKKKQAQKLSLKQRLAQQTIQKQLHILKLREYLVLVGLTLGAAALRAPMQVIPSAEPITFFAILAGWLFGKKKGFLVGAGALYASNFLVFGGHGIWTVFQALGFGLAGFLGGFLSKKARIWNVLLITILATLLFELIVNIGSIFMFPWGIFSLFITALPFTLIHLISNSAFAFLLPKTKKVVDEKGEFNQKEVCRALLKKFEAIKNLKVIKK